VRIVEGFTLIVCIERWCDRWIVRIVEGFTLIASIERWCDRWIVRMCQMNGEKLTKMICSVEKWRECCGWTMNNCQTALIHHSEKVQILQHLLLGKIKGIWWRKA
jgi:hypothetical protein